MLKVLWALESLFAVLGLLLFARLVIIATQLLNRPTSVLPRGWIAWLLGQVTDLLYVIGVTVCGCVIIVSLVITSTEYISYGWHYAQFGGFCGKTCSVKELSHALLGESGCPGWFGDRSIAQDVSKLKSLGVTHVLNAAHGAIDVSKEYEKVGIEYLGVPADDVPTYNLKQHFEPAAAFINTAVKKGKVLVHCHVGYSRSPTLVAAYLMLYQELTAQESITLIRGKRFIGPNDGFLRQLCEFNDQLVEEGRLELP
ncbi:dual specificity protein phosphatase 3-like isoform X3 [Branchiostoma floridae]|uniref:protein-serine/threonine phosphatase n=1 Tax=Branchiostoma floridae TaxID=7739 RepID=A0A9J7K8Q4_BRAFL|nr:dual specificity protein phosphatase 3-like isoform X3 [Branchiostoma floridae]